MKTKLGSILLSVIILLSISPGHVSAQQAGQPDGPVYIVQEGDTLWDIALRFGLTLDELESANGITDPNQISSGAQLVIPGIEGVKGILTTQTVPYGEDLRSLSLKYGVPVDTLVRLNHLSSRTQVYAGASLITLQQDQPAGEGQRLNLQPGESLLELAVSQGTSPWSLVATNALSGTWSALPGDVLHLPTDTAGNSQASPGALPEAIQSIELSPLPPVQGKAMVLRASAGPGITLSGSFLGHELHFFPAQDGGYVALQGIHALQDPGLYPLTLSGKLPNGTSFSFSQDVYVRDGNYPYDPPLSVSPELIDPAVSGPEDAQWADLAKPVSPDKLWSGVFKSPVAPPLDQCWPSLFGDRRSFNGSAYIYFHSGLDFCGEVGNEIHAPAAGKVVFTGSLNIRGNVTLIDHGWGVYTAYMHQSEILVKVGDQVQPGQLIGLIGSTGRVTGPHLHWEVIVGDVQVNPMDWLKQEFP
jgi:murein DD-endopeptidase MepM/ murein hydrolase activator NlpD